MKNIFSKILERVKNRKWFQSQLQQFIQSESATVSRFSLKKENMWPIYGEATETTGFDRHYVFHTAWAARIIASIRPHRHVDISSSLYFSAITSAFCMIDFFDYRPAKLGLSNLTTNSCNLTDLHFADESIECLSCMHVVEHIGLGRYGDSIDYDGDLKAIRELRRVTKRNGNLLFVVPVGQSRIQFNAHRIYSYAQVIELFPEFSLVQFALIPDDPEDGGLILEAQSDLADRQRYGCGCFWFKKK